MKYLLLNLLVFIVVALSGPIVIMWVNHPIIQYVFALWLGSLATCAFYYIEKMREREMLLKGFDIPLLTRDELIERARKKIKKNRNILSTYKK